MTEERMDIDDFESDDYMREVAEANHERDGKILEGMIEDGKIIKNLHPKMFEEDGKQG